MHLDRETAMRFARVALENVAREYPNHPGHLLTGPDDLAEPHRLHPVFFGSYDWHSAVHQHWLLLRLLRRHPDLPERERIHAWFDQKVTSDHVAEEVAYLDHPARRSFERPYGWAWLLRLAAEATELARSEGQHAPAAGRWAAALEPLRADLRERSLEWLAASVDPHRAGAHANSAYACRLFVEVAHVHADHELRAAVDAAATRWYLDDRAAPTRFEPSAADFLSPTLVEADLMASLLPAKRFLRWLDDFLTDPDPLTRAVTVSDRHDPQTVHLDGLNLSRAWCWLRIARALPVDDPRRTLAVDAARAQREASVGHVLDDYVGSHWLPTFAVELLDVEDRPLVGDPSPDGRV